MKNEQLFFFLFELLVARQVYATCFSGIMDIVSRKTPWQLVLILLIVMVLFSSWIALNNIDAPKVYLFQRAILAISLSGALTLIVITQGVLNLSPWYHAQTLIPLAGMVFASCMNSVSLSGERFYSELKNKVSYES